MRTPKEYSENLKNGIITAEMLEACLFSVNKRAKNCRDKIREYRRNRYFTGYEWIEIGRPVELAKVVAVSPHTG